MTAATNPTFPLESETTRLILVAGSEMDALGRRLFAPYGLTKSDVAPLTILDQFGPLTPKQLQASSPLLNSPQVVSHSVNRLLDAGMVTRTKNDADGRSVLIAITDKGSEIVSILLEQLQESSADFLEPLSTDEIALLRDLLTRILGPRDDGTTT
ncbi:MAG: MarR family transcriptional regulator [Acidimicrobiia bacterium]|nr:MarR family transcriptional regulator [Acidimicrobiia bacterium]